MMTGEDHGYEDFGPSHNFSNPIPPIKEREKKQNQNQNQDYHYDAEADYAYNSQIDQEAYCRQLELLMLKRREIANTLRNTSQIGPNIMTSPMIYEYDHNQSEAMEMVRKLYAELQERRKNKTCSRCGYYHKYHIDSQTTLLTPNDIGAEAQRTNTFFIVNYKIIKETVENPGTLDDDFYDVCKKCQKDMFEAVESEFKRDRNLYEIKRQFKILEQKESERQFEQNRLIDRLQKEFRDKRKEANKSKLEEAEKRVKDGITTLKNSVTDQLKGGEVRY